ncbi:hypothetical protein ACFL6C_12810 [Myxococcota bacterium]
MKAPECGSELGLGRGWLIACIACAVVSCDDAGSKPAKVDLVVTGAGLPVLTDWQCPAGWRVTPGFVDENGIENVPDGVAGFSICEPPEQLVCDEGSAQFLGTSTCSRLGTECPPERFLGEVEIRALASGFEGSIVYVDPEAASDGDGSRAAPRQRISDAVLSAASGGIVALAPAIHVEEVTLADDIALVGACVTETVIEAPDFRRDAGTINLLGAAASLVANLRVTGPRMGIWARRAGLETRIESVEIDAVAGYGIIVMGPARAFLDEVVIRDTLLFRDTDSEGYGFVVFNGGEAVLDDVVLERNRTHGVVAYDPGSVLEAHDLIIRATELQCAVKRQDAGLGLHVHP